MKQQVVHIHGGEAFSDYDAFLHRLTTQTISDPLTQKQKRWSSVLPELLGEEYEVYLPSMPNKQNSKYEEWKIWFERYFEFLRDDTILIGHSQGGAFLAKYFSEGSMPVSVRALFLVAAPFQSEDFAGEDGGDFFFEDVEKFKQGVSCIENVFVYHSKDDPVVPFKHGETYKKVLPNSIFHVFKDRGHFLDETFPELVHDIKALV